MNENDTVTPIVAPPVSPPKDGTVAAKLWRILNGASRLGCVGLLIWLGVTMLQMVTDLVTPLEVASPAIVASAGPGTDLGVAGLDGLSFEGRWLAGETMNPIEMEKRSPDEAKARLDALWASHTGGSIDPFAALAGGMSAAIGSPLSWRRNGDCRHARGTFGEADYSVCLPDENVSGKTMQILAFRRTEESSGILFHLEPAVVPGPPAVPRSTLVPASARPILTRLSPEDRLDLQLVELREEAPALEAHWKASGVSFERQQASPQLAVYRCRVREDVHLVTLLTDPAPGGAGFALLTRSP